MSSVVDTARGTPFHSLSPGAAALVPNPMSQRLRMRERLGPHVYLAEGILTLLDANNANNNANNANANFSPPQCVVKIGRLLHPWEHGSADAAASVSARQELRVARLLHASGGHAHVVRTLEIHVERRLSFLVLEHCEGGDLFGYVTSSARGRLSAHDALFKFHQIARGLQFLHDHNIAHRDLSLENILLRDGTCKICDFGMSTRADAVAQDVVGKTAYAAPEVVRGDVYDPVRADLWSLGIVLFMMLTGSPLVPFASSECAEFKALRVVGVRGVLRAWGMDAQFSVATIDLLTQLLQIQPQRRIGSTQELLRHPAMLASAAAARRHSRELTRL